MIPIEVILLIFLELDLLAVLKFRVSDIYRQLPRKKFAGGNSELFKEETPGFGFDRDERLAFVVPDSQREIVIAFWNVDRKQEWFAGSTNCVALRLQMCR